MREGSHEEAAETLRDGGHYQPEENRGEGSREKRGGCDSATKRNAQSEKARKSRRAKLLAQSPPPGVGPGEHEDQPDGKTSESDKDRRTRRREQSCPPGGSSGHGSFEQEHLRPVRAVAAEGLRSRQQSSQ